MLTADDIITTDKYLSLSNNNIVYLKTDQVKLGYDVIFWRDSLHKIRPGFIWITGHSDFSIDQSIFNKYHENCKYWYTTNKDYKHDKLYALPLGITNNTYETELHPIYGNVDIMMDVLKYSRKIQNLVYMSFTISTFPMERQVCHDMFVNKTWVTKGKLENSLKGRREFLEDIRNHTFVLCPRGNGIDTCRLWETLYMGSIPIVINTAALEEFKDLPILFIDNWEEINPELLNEKYAEIMSKTWNMEKLKFSYWERVIRERNSEFLA
jgi:hypothetical protein